MLDHDPSPHAAPPGALDEAEDPDPGFWGPEDPPRRRRRARRDPNALRLGLGGEGRAAMAVVAVITISAALISYRASSGPAPVPKAAAARAATLTPHAHVVVHVAGAVTRPGVVELRAGARVIDALDAAGGALAAADLNRLNLAALLRDGQQVLVPVGASSTTTSSSSPVPTTPG
ncbi:MAG TPA: SLBB domain-containing protein [Acidimicrobiia bacterium]|nr:SLBB domain-containing protein [Acidimicrobiia bacterium]